MSFITKSLRTKLLAGFGTVVLILVAIVVIAPSSSATPAQNAEDIGTADLPSAQTLGELNAEMSDYRLLQFEVAASSNAAERRAHEAELVRRFEVAA